MKRWAIYRNLPVDVIVRLPHPRRGDSKGQETFLAPPAYKQTRHYDIECSKHHPWLSTLRPEELSLSKMKWWDIYTDLPVDVIVRLPHLRRGDSQNQETLLARSAEKPTRNYDIECWNHHPSLLTPNPKGFSRSKMEWWAIYKNLTVDVIVRLHHPRIGYSHGQETFVASPSEKKSRNYDIECSNHHPSLSTLSPKGLSRSMMKWSTIYTNLQVDVIVRLPHLRTGESQGQETFLAPSADKKTRNYNIEFSKHHPSLSTLRPNGLSRSKMKWWDIHINFPVDVILRLPHLLNGNREGQKTCLASSAQKQTRHYDIECSKHHPSLSTIRPKGFSRSQMK